MKAEKILRIVVPVTPEERRFIRRAIAPVGGRAQSIAGWARNLMIKDAGRILGRSLAGEMARKVQP